MKLDEELDARSTAANFLLLFGIVLLVIGAWVLFHPTVELSDTVNLQKLYVGQTSALVGTVLFATGCILKSLR